MMSGIPAWAVGLLLASTVLALRWSTLNTPLWNVDEAIHAAAARTLLQGGTLYRDAIDQRTPLTYHAVAGVFALFGENRLGPVRGLVALLVAGTGFAVWLLGRRLPAPAAGAWAAAVFVALSTGLLVPADTFAAHTEWFSAFFAAWGAWLFSRREEAPRFGDALGTGAVYALAFLSKQPALLDFGAPLAVAAWLALTGRWSARDTLRTGAGLLAGFGAVTGVSVLWFAAHGALADAVFYAWTYNLRYYGAEVTWADRLEAACAPVRLLAREFPWALVPLFGTLGTAAVRLVQLRPDPAHRAADRLFCFLGWWTVLAAAGAASGGRDFEHYTIQCLPPLALAIGWALAAAWNWAADRWRASARAAAAFVAVAIGAAGIHLVWHTIGRSPPSPPPDPALRVSSFIRAHTTPADTLFVWGFNPDIYLYSNRRPASRFVYCSFLTGLIPWTNLEPHKDTAYAIVPGSMDTLLADLRARRPACIVDCSPGPHRHFGKYPVEKFPEFDRFLRENYAVTDDGTFVPQGFRLHLIRDHFRTALPPLAGSPDRRPPDALEINGPERAEAVPTPYLVRATDSFGRLQRVELRVNGKAVDGVSFSPAGTATPTLVAPFDRLGAGTHRLKAVATLATGQTSETGETVVTCGSTLDGARSTAFAVPVATTRWIPVVVDAPFGPRAFREGDARVFFLHAPSRLVFTLPGGRARVGGAFSIDPTAYAPDNKAPSDGARFQIVLQPADREPVVVFSHFLQPGTVPGDRAPQRFDVALPAHRAGDRVEFRIDTGPHNNGACDWTLWRDLQFTLEGE